MVNRKSAIVGERRCRRAERADSNVRSLSESQRGTQVVAISASLLSVSLAPSDGPSRLAGVDAKLEHIRAVIANSPPARTTFLESSVGCKRQWFPSHKENLGPVWLGRKRWLWYGRESTRPDLGEGSGLGSLSSSHAMASKTPRGRPTGGFCLADGRRLELRDIIALSRPRGGLAFLSACQTATGDERPSDEAVHVAAGMLLAGYEGMVGTMWSISDNLAPDVARGVYAQLFRSGTRPDDREAASALQGAVGRLRKRLSPSGCRSSM